MNQCFLFDLDGTLTDSAPGILHSVRFALDHFGIEKTDAELNPFIGPPLLDSFRKYANLCDADAVMAVKYYRQCFHDMGAMFENSVYDGIVPALNALRSLGIPLAVATAKPEVFARQIMDRFELSGYFDLICGATLDGRISDKTQVLSLALAECRQRGYQNPVMIGDREQDVTGAHNCGIPCAGVLWGYGSRSELTAAGADWLLETPAELISMIHCDAGDCEETEV